MSEKYLKLLEDLYFYMQENVASRSRPPKALLALLDSIQAERNRKENENSVLVIGD